MQTVYVLSVYVKNVYVLSVYVQSVYVLSVYVISGYVQSAYVRVCTCRVCTCKVEDYLTEKWERGGRLPNREMGEGWETTRQRKGRGWETVGYRVAGGLMPCRGRLYTALPTCPPVPEAWVPISVDHTPRHSHHRPYRRRR